MPDASLKIKDASGKIVLKIAGVPSRAVATRWSLKVVNVIHGIQIGHISKQWFGRARELLAAADCFSISFPLELEPIIKAVCLAAIPMIDYKHFENHCG